MSQIDAVTDHDEFPMLPRPDFRGECVIISGGARGIGAGIVRHFSQCGASIVFGDTDLIGARQLCEELEKAKGSVHFVEADFTAPDAWLRLRETAERLGFVASLVIPNVGLTICEPLDQVSIEHFDHLVNANLKSAWLAAREFSPTLHQRKGSSLVLIGSVMASFGTIGHGLYATSKAALSGLLRSLCVELGPQGIRVNMVVPGYIMGDPPILYRKTVPPRHWRAFHLQFGKEVALANPPVQPLAFWGQPVDIAHAIAFLHSSAARYISGTELRVDGGLLCQTPIPGQTGNDSWSWTDEMKDWLRNRGIESSSTNEEGAGT